MRSEASWGVGAGQIGRGRPNWRRLESVDSGRAETHAPSDRAPCCPPGSSARITRSITQIIGMISVKRSTRPPTSSTTPASAAHVLVSIGQGWGFVATGYIAGRRGLTPRRLEATERRGWRGFGRAGAIPVGYQRDDPTEHLVIRLASFCRARAILARRIRSRKRAPIQKPLATLESRARAICKAASRVVFTGLSAAQGDDVFRARIALRTGLLRSPV
jgi:hypothetical protein